MYKYSKKAFTLVELIIVITIIAILGTITFISLQGYSASARDSKRISDIQNIKKALEFFSLNTGKYPYPDNGLNMSFSGDLLRNQGVIGDVVTSNLSKNLNNKPLDPLTETEYIYSVINSQNEYELLGIYESDLFSYNNIFKNVNADNSIYPKIDGTYNGVYVKTSNYYVVTPSIINSEITNTGMILDNTNIKSQIITGGENILQYGINESKIRNLGNLNLNFYTGTINKNSTSIEKINLMNVFKNAFSGTQLTNKDLYKIIVETQEGDSEQFINNFVLHSFDNSLLTKVNGECGVDYGQDLINNPSNLCNYGIASSIIDNGIGNTYEWSCLGMGGGNTVNCNANHIASRYPGCGFDDVIVGSYTVSRCDAGNGAYYQWGRDKGFISGDTSQQATIIDGNIGLEAGIDTYGFVWNSTLPSPYSWANSDISDNWGYISNTNSTKQGPCEDGYHVPTQAEWAGLISTSGWTSGSSLYTNLGLAYGGFRQYFNGAITTSTPARGYYWSSTPVGNNAYLLYFYNSSTAGTVNPSRSDVGLLAYGMKIRCFRN